jgi:hypothetical protein|tara:strand:- start:229 stop:411 length:183 start_codon:yes stop_codon:yes gene_type:complete
MKNLVLATVFAVAATIVSASGMSEPEMDAPIVASTMDAAAGSSTGILIPLLIIALIAVVK